MIPKLSWIGLHRVAAQFVVQLAFETIFSMSQEERKALGAKGREHVIKNYNFEKFNQTWIDVLTQLHEDEGSWETRKQTQRWTLQEIGEEQNESIG